jgi:hypothetical protein
MKLARLGPVVMMGLAELAAAALCFVTTFGLKPHWKHPWQLMFITATGALGLVLGVWTLVHAYRSRVRGSRQREEWLAAFEAEDAEAKKPVDRAPPGA